MAHADYSCCAVCDCKMGYGGEATKESICMECLEWLQSKKIPVVSYRQLMLWISIADVEKLTLIRQRFNLCIYENDVDKEMLIRLKQLGLDKKFLDCKFQPQDKEVKP